MYLSKLFEPNHINIKHILLFYCDGRLDEKITESDTKFVHETRRMKTFGKGRKCTNYNKGNANKKWFKWEYVWEEL